MPRWFLFLGETKDPEHQEVYYQVHDADDEGGREALAMLGCALGAQSGAGFEFLANAAVGDFQESPEGDIFLRLGERWPHPGEKPGS